MLKQILNLRNVVVITICFAGIIMFAGCGPVPCDPTDPNGECYVPLDNPDNRNVVEINSATELLNGLQSRTDSTIFKFSNKTLNFYNNLTADTVKQANAIAGVNFLHTIVVDGVKVYVRNEDVNLTLEQWQVIYDFLGKQNDIVKESESGFFTVTDETLGVAEKNPNATFVKDSTNASGINNGTFPSNVAGRVVIVNEELDADKIKTTPWFPVKLLATVSQNPQHLGEVKPVVKIDVPFLQNVAANKIICETMKMLGLHWDARNYNQYPPYISDPNGLQINNTDVYDVTAPWFGVLVRVRKELQNFLETEHVFFKIVPGIDKVNYAFNNTPANSQYDGATIIDRGTVTSMTDYMGVPRITAGSPVSADIRDMTAVKHTAAQHNNFEIYYQYYSSTLTREEAWMKWVGEILDFNSLSVIFNIPPKECLDENKTPLSLDMHMQSSLGVPSKGLYISGHDLNLGCVPESCAAQNARARSFLEQKRNRSK